MIWPRRPASPARPRPARHGRHGRTGRSPVVPPPLPPLESRQDRFELVVHDTAQFLRDAWEDLREVSFEVGIMPTRADAEGMPRWFVDREARRIVIFRLPIERLDRANRTDDLSAKMSMEGAVFRAAAEYLDRDPWDLGTQRWRG